LLQERVRFGAVDDVPAPDTSVTRKSSSEVIDSLLKPFTPSGYDRLSGDILNHTNTIEVREHTWHTLYLDRIGINLVDLKGELTQRFALLN
jgi:hypothetical protein